MTAVKKAAPERAAYTKEQRDADTCEMIHAINANSERRCLEDALFERMDAERRAARKQRADDMLALLLIGAALLAGGGPAGCGSAQTPSRRRLWGERRGDREAGVRRVRGAVCAEDEAEPFLLQPVSASVVEASPGGPFAGRRHTGASASGVPVREVRKIRLRAEPQ